MIGENQANLEQTPEFDKKPGGAPANVAVAAARLNQDVEIIATVGKDSFGEFLIQKMNEENIKADNIRQSELKTTLAFVALDENSEPDFSFYRRADKHISSIQLNHNYKEDDIIHLGSLPFTNEQTANNILEFIEKTPAKISFDPNLREELLTENYKETLEKVLEHTNYLFLSDEETEFFGGIENLKEKADETIVTQGSEGVKLYTENEEISKESHDVAVVDTTGAGDALTGSYLAHRNLGKEKALEKAVMSSSMAITEKGAMSALPTEQELQEFQKDLKMKVKN